MGLKQLFRGMFFGAMTLVLSSLSTTAAQAQLDGDTFVGIGSPPAGVKIDAEGVLTRVTWRDPTGALLKLRIKQQRANLDAKLMEKSPLRMISLQRLEAALKARLDKDQPPSDEMKNLAGLTRIQYVFYMPETKDIVIAGPAEGFIDDTSGRMVGIESGSATLQLEDLVVALRAFAPGKAGAREIFCSIDPTQDGLKRLQGAIKQAHRQMRVRPNNNQVRQLVHNFREALGLQTITLKGISPKTHMSQVLVEADYRMKLIGIGMERVPRGVKIPSYVSRANPTSVSRNALQRWYFMPNYEAVRVSDDNFAMELVGDGVKLISEAELVAQDGNRSAAGFKNKASEMFVTSFTKNYSKLAKKSPVYGQLRDVIDLTIAAAYIRQQDFYSKSGWKMSTLGDEEKFAVETYNAPKHTFSAVTAIWKGRSLMTPIGGGVSIHPTRALTSENLLEDEDGKVRELHESVSLADLPANAWWWNGAK